MDTTNKYNIQVCYTPQLFPLYDNGNSIVVVIDVLRATSAICVAFENGIKEIIPVASVDEAREYQKQDYLVAAERHGLMVEGFQFGNSPFHFMTEKIRGKSLVLTTTNGTQAIHQARDSHKVAIGAFVNISTLCNWLIGEKRGIILLCAGWKNKFNLEDTLFAGAVVDRLLKSGGYSTKCDSAIAANHLYRSAEEDLFGFLENSSHRMRLSSLNLEDDVKFCLTFDSTNVIPVLDGDSLVCFKQEDLVKVASEEGE